MKVQKVSPSINFKSGLNRGIIAKSNTIIPIIVEGKIAKSKGIDAKFFGYKVNAFCVEKALEILDILKEKTGRNIFNANVPNIRTYSKNDLSFPFNGYGFCLPESRKVLKNEPAFETGSVFYPQEKFLEELDEKVEESYNNNERSSSHFLAPTFHEIFHEKYLDFIYKKYGYDGKCPFTKEKYSLKNPVKSGLDVLKRLEKLSLNVDENEVVRETLGNYSTQNTNQYHEIFAETFTKLVCDSLSKDLIPLKNPYEIMKTLPKEFLFVFNKILNI